MTLREIRIACGFRQTVVANRLGVKQAAVSKWEAGKSYPTPDRIARLASLYKATADEIIKAISEAKNAEPQIDPPDELAG
ncbi:helix-turn-helix domain-containing protein [Ruminococcaceae bacterium OttesenSCG-928-D13]|nr:helix-turn-helix domain-containing protein [Ruminococcaceae bacterium OttesenSCG-928-D13]